MARFIIYHSDGTEVCNCTPVYHGTYLQPAYLEVRSLAETDAINLRIGDYITWRDGRTYTLYSLPNVTQNAATVIGDRLTYDNLQFHDACKQLEIALWRDLVEYDNSIHFSTQKDIATYESLDGIRRRIRSCLDAIYPGQWSVKVADGLSDPSSDYYRSDITDPQEFSLEAGSSVLDALNLIYDTWTLIGWTFSVVDGVNVITIGGANVKGSNVIPDYAIGKGNGITKIKATLSNSAEIATRIYPFGSSSNLPARYYNGKNIYNAESVDIQNVMIPVSYWGRTYGLPDASKAYLEDTTVSSVLGVRPKVIYMDGDEYGDIYPSIEGVTIGDIISAKNAAGDTTYVPSTSIYSTSERADELKGVSGGTDSGYRTSSDTSVKATAHTQTVSSAQKEETEDFIIGSADSPLFTCSIAVGTYPSYTFASDALATFAFSPYTTSESETASVYRVSLMVSDGTSTQEVILYDGEIKVSDAVSFAIPSTVKDAFLFDGKENTTQTLSMWLKVSYYKPTGTFTATSLSSLTVSAKNNIRTVQEGITLKQIGFDISDYKATSNLGYIAFKSGACSGRSFRIASCEYVPATDSWSISIKRTYDKDLKQYFPNTYYQLSAGDRFVLTDIMMPEIYVATAEQRLYNRAVEILEDISKPIFVLEPSLDSKHIDENEAILLFKPGVYFDFATDVFIDNYYSNLIDTVTVTESEYAIPTVSITLREKKRKSFKTASTSSSSSSSSSSDSTVDEDTTASSSSGTSITVDTALSSTSGNPVANSAIYEALAKKQDDITGKTIGTINGTALTYGGSITVSGGSTITVDTAVTSGSGNPVTSKAIYDELAKKQNSLTETQLAAVNSGITSTKVSTYDGYATTIAGKQNTLTETQLAAVNSGITSTKVSTYDTYGEALANKAERSELPSVTDTVTEDSTEVVTSGGVYSALQGKQDSLSGQVIGTINGNSLTYGGSVTVSVPDMKDYVKEEDLAAVATSGLYADLTGKPTLATVATSGSYNDLSDKPTILTTDQLATVATTGSYHDLDDKPSYATVASTGSYNDLLDKPTIQNLEVLSYIDDSSKMPVESQAIYAALAAKADTSETTAIRALFSNYVKVTDMPNIISTVDKDDSSSVVTSAGIYTAIQGKQDALDTYTELCKINGVSIKYGNDNTLSTSALITVDEDWIDGSKNPVRSETIQAALDNKIDKNGSDTYPTVLFNFQGQSTTLAVRYTGTIYASTLANMISPYISASGDGTTIEISTTLDKDSTDATVPSSKTVYDAIKNFVASDGFKTVNGESIIGSGNITVSGGSGGNVTIVTTLDDTASNGTVPSSLAVYDALQGKQDDLNGKTIATINGTALTYGGSITVSGSGESITVDPSITSSSSNPVTSSAIYAALQGKQNTLVSGTSIKTINGTSILGSGDITVSGSSASVGVDTLIKMTPVLTIKEEEISSTVTKVVRVSHPCVSNSSCEIVLMRYAQRDQRLRSTRSGSSERFMKKGWVVARGYRNGTVLTYSHLTSSTGMFRLSALRDYIVKHFMRWTGKTLDTLLASSYSTWTASSDTDRGFGRKKSGHARFGIAVRYINPAFTELVDSTKTLHIDTTCLSGYPRYIYSPVAPLDAILRSSAGTHDRRYMEFGLTGATPICDVSGIIDTVNGEEV